MVFLMSYFESNLECFIRYTRLWLFVLHVKKLLQCVGSIEFSMTQIVVDLCPDKYYFFHPSLYLPGIPHFFYHVPWFNFWVQCEM